MSMKERQVRRLDAAALWEYALKALGGHAHSTGELREKLRRRAERSEDIDDVLARPERKAATSTTNATPKAMRPRDSPAKSSAARG